jgi:hypothetical protein
MIQAVALVNKHFACSLISGLIAKVEESNGKRTQLLHSSAVEWGRDRK